MLIVALLLSIIEAVQAVRLRCGNYSTTALVTPELRENSGVLVTWDLLSSDPVCSDPSRLPRFTQLRLHDVSLIASCDICPKWGFLDITLEEMAFGVEDCVADGLLLERTSATRHLPLQIESCSSCQRGAYRCTLRLPMRYEWPLGSSINTIFIVGRQPPYNRIHTDMDVRYVVVDRMPPSLRNCELIVRERAKIDKLFTFSSAAMFFLIFMSVIVCVCCARYLCSKIY